jgi:hypothetical protein
MPVMSLPFTQTSVVTSASATYRLAGPLGTVELKAHRADALLNGPPSIEVWVHCRRGPGPASCYCDVLGAMCWTDVLTGRAAEAYRGPVEAESYDDIFALLEAEYYRSCEQEARR